MIEIAFIEGRSDELKKALLADPNRRLVETADVRLTTCSCRCTR